MSKVISVITPCFNEGEGVVECYEAVREIFKEKLPGYNYEHIFCDNASTDSTVIFLRKIAANDDRVKVIINSRNFGILRNTYNGVLNATGDAVLLFLPADMQDPPALIPEFVKHWENGYEIIYGIRKDRKEPFIMRFLRKSYYRLISRISYISYPADVGDFQLIDRTVHNVIKTYPETEPFLRMMTFDCGFNSIGVPYTWEKRIHGKSKNKFAALLHQGLTGIISFSNAPMRLALFAGVIIAVGSFLAAIGFVVMRMYFGEYAPKGIFAILVSVFFFSGINLIFLGIIGEYILSIRMLVRRRPPAIERERINFSGKKND